VAAVPGPDLQWHHHFYYPGVATIFAVCLQAQRTAPALHEPAFFSLFNKLLSYRRGPHTEAAVHNG
jgi:hypothetical protein